MGWSVDMILEGWLFWPTDRGRPRLWWTAPSLRQGVLRQTPRECYPTCIDLLTWLERFLCLKLYWSLFLQSLCLAVELGQCCPLNKLGRTKCLPFEEQFLGSCCHTLDAGRSMPQSLKGIFFVFMFMYVQASEFLRGYPPSWRQVSHWLVTGQVR